MIADLGQLLISLGQVADQDVAGIVGQDALSEHRAIIDVARSMLYLMEDDAEPAPVAAANCDQSEQE